MHDLLYLLSLKSKKKNRFEMFQVNEQMCKKYLTVSINESYGRP